VDQLLLHGGAVLEDVGADTRLGFGVGGGVGVEAHDFGGMTVGHGAREDQAGKGYFLIGDGVADFIFGHRWLLGILREVRAQVFHCLGKQGGTRKKSRSTACPAARRDRRGEMLGSLIL
jgi:hypothetical protein